MDSQAMTPQQPANALGKRQDFANSQLDSGETRCDRTLRRPRRPRRGTTAGAAGTRRWYGPVVTPPAGPAPG
ncbi:protein of unknown function [Streptantibioticus cattleyicolor NRRL 8057 = DSM 46488]|nr:protein of unknown function [Streptantibioticus cattleyicolor NRRL 8057 = DSM 46488]